MRKGLTALILSSAFIVTGCGDNDLDGSKTRQNNIIGTWATPCQSYTDSSWKTTYDFLQTTFTIIYESYDDPSCETATYTSTASGDYIVGSTVTTNSGTEAKEIDIHYTAYDDYEADYMVYDIFTTENDSVLYFGSYDSDNDGTSEDKRFTDINYYSHYTRQ